MLLHKRLGKKMYTKEEIDTLLSNIYTKEELGDLLNLRFNNVRMLGPPDYNNMEGTNRGNSWTVDRDGYLSCTTTTSSGSNRDLRITINGKNVFWAAGTSVTPTITIPVRKGDVYYNYIAGAACYFIPPIA